MFVSSVEPRNELEAIGKKHGPTKQYGNFLLRYWTHFSTIRDNVTSVLEIGVQSGTSLRMWEEFFPNATIVGIDIDPDCKKNESDRCKVAIANSADNRSLDEALESTGIKEFDIIIDDGSHFYKDQIETFKNLFPRLRMGGFYAVEDLACAASPHRMLAVNALQEFIDGINYFPSNLNHWRMLPTIDVDNEYVRQIVGASFYRHVCIVEKGLNPEVNPYLPDYFKAADTSDETLDAKVIPKNKLDYIKTTLQYLSDRRKRHFIPKKLVRARSLFSMIRRLF